MANDCNMSVSFSSEAGSETSSSWNLIIQGSMSEVKMTENGYFIASTHVRTIMVINQKPANSIDPIMLFCSQYQLPTSVFQNLDDSLITG